MATLVVCALLVATGRPRGPLNGWFEILYLAETGRWSAAAALAGVWGLGLAAVAGALLARGRGLWWAGVAVFALTTCADEGYRAVTGSMFGYGDALDLVQNAGFGLAGGVWRTYGPLIARGVGRGLLVAGALVALAAWLRSRLPTGGLPRAGTLLLPAAWALTYAALEATQANRVSFAAPVRIPALVAYAHYNQLYRGDRREPATTPTREPLADHIVLVVDESVRGDWLGLNGGPYDTTPFLDSVAGGRVVNFGVASSAAICSNYSHHVLMSGLRPRDVPDRDGVSLRGPSLFQRAARAGFHAGLVYVPAKRDAPHGFLNPSDLDDLPTRVLPRLLYPGLPNYRQDSAALTPLADLIAGRPRTLTYFLKQGAHFSYDDSYPGSKAVFRPVLGGDDWSFSNRAALRNSYANALRHNVDDFFRALEATLPEGRVLVVYTGDHGQNVMDDPRYAQTHCLKEPAPAVMAAVPLLLYARDSALLADLRALAHAGAPVPRSHFDVFPTLLRAMGYDSAWVRDAHGRSLFEPPPSLGQSAPFFSGDLFGRSAVYANEFAVPRSGG